MSTILAIDPGVNTGVAWGSFSAEEPFELRAREQVHGGLTGFIRWAQDCEWIRHADVLVCEKFVLAEDNMFAPDLTPVQLEGVITMLRLPKSIVWQPRTDKAALTGYPASAKTKAQRQRVRFDFLKEHGLFAAGTDNDDSNDAITHALVYLKRSKHLPTLLKFWGPKG